MNHYHDDNVSGHPAAPDAEPGLGADRQARSLAVRRQRVRHLPHARPAAHGHGLGGEPRRAAHPARCDSAGSTRRCLRSTSPRTAPPTTTWSSTATVQRHRALGRTSTTTSTRWPTRSTQAPTCAATSSGRCSTTTSGRGATTSASASCTSTTTRSCARPSASDARVRIVIAAVEGDGLIGAIVGATFDIGERSSGREARVRGAVPTLEMVAARAGVSRATVSRVVNGSPKVTPDVAEAVQRAIDDAQLRAQPGRADRSPAAARQAIALIVPESTATRLRRPVLRLDRAGHRAAPGRHRLHAQHAHRVGVAGGQDPALPARRQRRRRPRRLAPHGRPLLRAAESHRSRSSSAGGR